eukprot:evm.model.NODE_33649_length_13480_cov_31.276781.2
MAVSFFHKPGEEDDEDEEDEMERVDKANGLRVVPCKDTAEEKEGVEEEEQDARSRGEEGRGEEREEGGRLQCCC